MELTKVCTGCGENKPLSDFNKRKKSLDGYRLDCRVCQLRYQKGYTSKNPDLVRESKYLCAYNTSLAEIEALKVVQNNECAIDGCKNLPTRVDHDHSCCPGFGSCGKCIRGITCNGCNASLGHAFDSIHILSAWDLYLQNNLNWPIDRSRIIPRLNSSFYFPDDPWPQQGIKTETHKTCGVCRNSKEKTDFTLKADGYLAECTECGVEKSRRNQLATKYCITLEEYNWMLEMQGGCCGTCPRTPEEDGRALSVDHCHEGDFIRGLLCINCNLGIGNVKHNVKIIQGLMGYLSRDTARCMASAYP